MGLGLEPSGPCSTAHLTSSLGGRELLSGSQLAGKRIPGDLHTDRHRARAQSPCQRLHSQTRTQRNRARVPGAQKMLAILSCTWHTRTHALTWSLSHTESRTHTQAPGRPVAPQLWFLREQGEREGGPGRPRAGSDPSPAPPGRRASLSEAVGAVGGGTRVPSFPAFSQARWTSFPHLPPLRTKLFPLSPPRQLPAARISVGTRSFPAPSPGRGSGRLHPRGRKQGAAWLVPGGRWGGRREGAGREPERREPGAPTSACFPRASGRRAVGPGLSPVGVKGRRMTPGEPETAGLEP